MIKRKIQAPYRKGTIKRSVIKKAVQKVLKERKPMTNEQLEERIADLERRIEDQHKIIEDLLERTYPCERYPPPIYPSPSPSIPPWQNPWAPPWKYICNGARR